MIDTCINGLKYFKSCEILVVQMDQLPINNSMNDKFYTTDVQFHVSSWLYHHVSYNLWNIWMPVICICPLFC